MKVKKAKQNLQLLIHGIDERVYKAVIKLAADEKRSAGKQAEYMLSKYLEQNNIKHIEA